VTKVDAPVALAVCGQQRSVFVYVDWLLPS
jgi:hypothetical protein